MSVRTIICAPAALACGALAFSPAMDVRADASFAWHMVQHLIVLFAIPFFVLAAEPFRIFAQFAPKSWTARLVRATRPLHNAAHPAVALGAFIATLWFTHFSPLYELALEHASIHVAEHALYFVAGLLFWTPVLAPPPLRPLAFPARVLYLFVALPQGALLGFALAGSRHVLYAHYAGTANAFADQQNAAAVMWIGGGLTLLAAFLCTIGAWAVRESGQDARVVGGAR